jgi:amino acid transporter
MNVVILISVLSIGCAGVYGGSRTLSAMAGQGYAPSFFSYIDKSGRPLFSVLFMLVWSLLAYINLNASGPDVFQWLLALSGLAALFTWGSVCVAHIRFRAAWKHQGHTLDEIPFCAIAGVWGSWLGLVLIVLVLIAQVSLTGSLSRFSSPYAACLLLIHHPVIISFFFFFFFFAFSFFVVYVV